MPTVTVEGAGGKTISLEYDSKVNASLAQQIADAITAGIDAGTILPYDNSSKTPPPTPLPPPGQPAETIGEFVQTKNGATTLPDQYDDVVDRAASATITGNGDPNLRLLVGDGKLVFDASSKATGSGSVVGGGGNDRIIIPGTDDGAWRIVLGNGDNTIEAAGGGNDTISTGTGRNLIQLGGGQSYVTDLGRSTILGGDGAATVVGGNNNELVSIPGSNKGDWLIALGSGNDTVIAKGSGNDTISAGTGKNLIQLGAGISMVTDLGKSTILGGTGSGTIVGGGGNELVSIPGANTGDWRISLGDGNDTVLALGSGNDTITTGTGNNFIQLGAGKNIVNVHGKDTIQASSGNETVDASGGNATDLIHADSSKLFFIAAGNTTVYGETGSVTVQGGNGTELVYGGSAGLNSIQAGSGKATLFGGGDGDQLFASGSKAQLLTAGHGAESLYGSTATGSDTFVGGSGAADKTEIFGNAVKDTFVASGGNTTIHAALSAQNLFEYIKGAAPGAEVVQGLLDASQVTLVLSGYGGGYTPAQGFNAKGNLTLTLTDGSTITFENIHDTIPGKNITSS